MFHTLEVPDRCLLLWQTCQSLVPQLLKDCPVKATDVTIHAGQGINTQSKSVYLIKSGVVSEKYEGQLLVNYEDGDLIATESLLQPKASTFEHEFAVNVDEYDGQDFLNSILQDKEKFLNWNRYMACMNESFQILMCHFSHQDVEFNPEFRTYKKGDTIIEENTEGDAVYTLLTGTTKVMIKGTEVGEINKDEIFGAIAALTNTKRNASVVATSDCETIIIKAESFRGLLAARPGTVHKLITDMARTIVSCNDRIMDLVKSS